MNTLVKSGKIIFILLIATIFISCEEEYIPALSNFPSGDLKSQVPEPSVKNIIIQTVFGPEQFMQLQWKTLKVTMDVVIENHDQYHSKFIVNIQNGSDEGDYMVSRATVRINGELILEIDDHNKKQLLHEFVIELPESSVLDVEISRRPVSYLTVSIDGILNPGDEPGEYALRNAEEIFSQIHPAYLYLFNSCQGNPPILPDGLSAKYLTNEDNSISLASVSFSGYRCSTGYLINGTMDIKSVFTGDFTQPPHQANLNFSFNGNLKASGEEFPEFDYYNYLFHIILNNYISWPDHPDPSTKTVLTEYDFESMYVFINNESISPGIILDIMGK